MGLQTAFTADYVLGISIYIHATVRSFGPLLDTSAIRGKNMKHSDCNEGTSPTMGDARPVYTTVKWTHFGKDIRAQKTDVFFLFNFTLSVSFTFMYSLTAPVRQTEV